MKKKILILLLVVTTVSMLAGCGKDDGGRERERREESDYEQEESGYEQETNDSDTASEPEEPEEKPLLTSAYASAKPGNEFQFGAYEQDNNLSDGAEPIEWVVLANEGDRILVLSKYVLVGEPEEIRNGEIEDDKIPGESGALTWEVSSERKWLNSTFYQEAFSDEERSCILQSEITGGEYRSGDYLGMYMSYCGSDTMDYLFLLRVSELDEYVEPLNIVNTEATEASCLKPDDETGYVSWLLRTSGPPQEWIETDDLKDHRNDISLGGFVEGYSDDFLRIDGKAGNYTDKLHMFHGRLNDSTGLRMAMWLKVE